MLTFPELCVEYDSDSTSMPSIHLKHEVCKSGKVNHPIPRNRTHGRAETEKTPNPDENDCIQEGISEEENFNILNKVKGMVKQLLNEYESEMSIAIIHVNTEPCTSRIPNDRTQGRSEIKTAPNLKENGGVEGSNSEDIHLYKSKSYDHGKIAEDDLVIQYPTKIPKFRPRKTDFEFKLNGMIIFTISLLLNNSICTAATTEQTMTTLGSSVQLNWFFRTDDANITPVIHFQNQSGSFKVIQIDSGKYLRLLSRADGQTKITFIVNNITDTDYGVYRCYLNNQPEEYKDISLTDFSWLSTNREPVISTLRQDVVLSWEYLTHKSINKIIFSRQNKITNHKENTLDATIMSMPVHKRRGPYTGISAMTRWRQKKKSIDADNSCLEKDDDVICETESINNCDSFNEGTDFLSEDVNSDEKITTDEDDSGLYTDDEEYDSLSENENTEDASSTFGDKRPIYKGARLSLSVSILLIITFITRHGMSGEALKDLLVLIELHCIAPNIFRSSVKFFKDFFQEMKSPVQNHYFCSNCHKYYGLNKPTTCEDCEQNDIGYFLVIPLISQLRQLISRAGILNLLTYTTTRRKENDDAIEDIVDGDLYKSVFENGYFIGSPDSIKQSEVHISFQLNTDGVQLFNSSKFSIWPIYLTINELSPKQRYTRENRLFIGLWFGNTKPVMDIFLRPVVEEIQMLYKAGCEITLQNGDVKTLRAVILSAVCDAPARCALQNFVQFNGFFGCGTCYEKGQSAKTGNGSTMTYPYNMDDRYKHRGFNEERSHSETVEIVKQVVESKKNIKGVKGISMLYLLPQFDIIRGVTIDYMHCVVLGVMKSLLNLWLQSSHRQEEYFIGDSLVILNERILGMTPPYFITRSPRGFSDIAYWKASEYRTFLLYYSVPCLIGILPTKFFMHFLCLNKAMFILLQKSITKSCLATAQDLISKFCIQVDYLYGTRYELSNCHALLHIPTKVKDLGPLWAHSCFFYEDLNGDLRKLFHGTQQVALQISKQVVMHQQLPLLANDLELGSPAHTFYLSLKSRYASRNKYPISHDIYASGTFRKCSLSLEIFNKIQTLVAGNILDSYIFYKIIKNGVVFHGKNYQRVLVRNSYTVKYLVNRKVSLGQIQYFLKLRTEISDEHFAVVLPITILKNAELPFNVKEVKVIESSVIISIHSILEHCMFMKEGVKCYVAAFPNMIEKD